MGLCELGRGTCKSVVCRIMRFVIISSDGYFVDFLRVG